MLASIPGDRGLEAYLHHRFAFARIRGEWFNPVPELLQLVWTAGFDPNFYIPHDHSMDLASDDGSLCSSGDGKPVVDRFLRAFVVRREGATVKSSDLFYAFEAWCAATTEGTRLSNRAFTEALLYRGYYKRKSSVVWWVGIELAAPGAGDGQ